MIFDIKLIYKFYKNNIYKNNNKKDEIYFSKKENSLIFDIKDETNTSNFINKLFL